MLKGTYNENHHLWNNHGVWFIHYTYYPTPATKQRVRFSLKTSCLLTARLRRDEYLVKFNREAKLSKNRVPT